MTHRSCDKKVDGHGRQWHGFTPKESEADKSTICLPARLPMDFLTYTRTYTRSTRNAKNMERMMLRGCVGARDLTGR